MNYKEIDDTYIAHTYARFPLCIERGEGVYVYDEQGRKYIDFTSGIGVNSLGYAYPQWVLAVSKQASTLAHTSNLYYTKPMLELAPKLLAKSGMKKVFFANSGAEANEGALKIARKYAEKYEGKRTKILSLVNSFHGRTIATLKATGQDVFHQHFGPFPEGFDYLEAGNFDELYAKANEETIAILIELVQGEGGVLALDPTYVDAIQSLCDAQDILLIIDEVQTGIGRTGTFFAYQQFGLHPDLVTSAKGLGGGLPIGAVLMNKKTENVFQYGDHGTTYGANPIACAGANVVLDTLDDAFLSDVQSKGAYIKANIEKMNHVKSVNGLGMMIGVELEGKEVKDVVNGCIEKGALFLTAKANLRLLPPLIMNKTEIDEGLAILASVLND